MWELASDETDIAGLNHDLFCALHGAIFSFCGEKRVLAVANPSGSQCPPMGKFSRAKDRQEPAMCSRSQLKPKSL
jgi:hypothetical protein